MDTWRDVGQVLKLWIRLVKNQILGGKEVIFWLRPWESKKERKKESKTPFFNPSNFIGRNSSSQELKFITSTRAMCVYQKGGISPKIQMRRFGEMKVFGLRRCS